MQLKPVCEEIYQEMVSEVYVSRQIDLSATSRVTYCFKVCMDYWNRLKEQLRSYTFASEEEEIWFFKSLKPKFTSLIEYYTFVYHGLLFMPALAEDDMQAFWNKEKDKIKQFYSKNAAFCQYYKSGNTSLDQLYFLRSNAIDCLNCYNKLYDTDAQMVTTHGHLVSTLLAYDMYDAYLQQEAKKVDDRISL
jgi:hypothetical protein